MGFQREKFYPAKIVLAPRVGAVVECHADIEPESVDNDDIERGADGDGYPIRVIADAATIQAARAWTALQAAIKASHDLTGAVDGRATLVDDFARVTFDVGALERFVESIVCETIPIEQPRVASGGLLEKVEQISDGALARPALRVIKGGAS